MCDLPLLIKLTFIQNYDLGLCLQLKVLHNNDPCKILSSILKGSLANHGNKFVPNSSAS